MHLDSTSIADGEAHRQVFTKNSFFLRKMLGTQYGTVGTQFL